MIPFSPPYIDDDVIKEVVDSLQSGWITTGPKVRDLEKEVSSYIGLPDVLCVNSATSAMMLAMHWFGIKKGDEVIIPAYTYAATALAVMHLGAVPVMVDVKEDFCIDPSKIAQAVTTRTKAVIPVDLGGFPCSYDQIKEVIDSVKHKFKPGSPEQEKLGRIFLMADSAHSFGAKYKDLHSGSLADITVFSFHAVKNLTTAEGGAICLNMSEPFDNAEIKKWLKLISLNGQTKDAFTKSAGNSWRYDIVYPGFKMNMPDVCAAIGLAQIKKYDTLLQKRKEIFEQYNKAFSAFEWAQAPPSITADKETSYHVYLLRIKGINEQQRDKMIEEIYVQDVSANVHFVPLPMLSLFKEMGYDIKDYPVSYDNYSSEITLPLYPQLKDEEISKIVDSVVNAYKKVISVSRVEKAL